MRSLLSNVIAFVIEVNPRASRTVPFVANGLLSTVGREGEAGEKMIWACNNRPYIVRTCHTCPLKRPCYHLLSFLERIPYWGPEMRSTGEVMGLAPDYAHAFAKSQLRSYFNPKAVRLLRTWTKSKHYHL